MDQHLWERFADELCPPGERREAIAGMLRDFYVFLQYEGAIKLLPGKRDDEDDHLVEPEGDSDAEFSEEAALLRIRDELRQLKEEVRAMANNETLDQAVNDLGAAVTNKLAVDQQLDTAEANLAGDTQKVQ